jgi:hypothetical protein
MGIFRKEGEVFVPTRLASVFLKLYSDNRADSWRWLVARSLWRFVVPNGTACKVNGPARIQNTKFAFFHVLVQLLTHLSGLSGEQRYLYFEELCHILKEDANWKLDGRELFDLLMKARSEKRGGFGSTRAFLADLENSLTDNSEFEIPRDNFSGFFLKAFTQTGFFQLREGLDGKKVAIALNPDLDAVLQRRVRFILDNPPAWNGTDWAGYLELQDRDLPQEVVEDKVDEDPEAALESENLKELIPALRARIDSAKLQVSTEQLLRFVSCLGSKRFLIFTGLAGSGKTKLAQVFARWITPGREESSAEKHYALVPVGADWTGNENIIGYPDGLRSPIRGEDGSSLDGAYVTKPTLDLIIHAKAHPDAPHFLILDEMNLSHVERYFADLLSMIESQESITLYCDERGESGFPKNTRGVEPVLNLPPNFFIIGTVNVDETTYMFSPKVLDRANVMEFRVTEMEMANFLGNPGAPSLSGLDGKGSVFGKAFVAAANDPRLTVPAEVKDRFNEEMKLFFAVLREHGAEFGYRVAHEASRFLHFYKLLADARVWNSKAEEGNGGWTLEDDSMRDWFDHAFDAIVVQKILPKLHGSKAKLGPLLRKIHTLCLEPPGSSRRDAGILAILNGQKSATQLAEPSRPIPSNARYPITAEKIIRMWLQLSENGFTSFPEN